MRKLVVSRLGVTLLVLSFAACKTVGVIGYPVEFIDTHSPEHVWVTQADKSVTEIYGPKITGDTLAGFRGKNGEYVEIPVSDIQLMKAPQFSPMKTALLAGTIAIGSGLILAAVAGTNGGANVCYLPGGANNGLPYPCPKPAAWTDGGAGQY